MNPPTVVLRQSPDIAGYVLYCTSAHRPLTGLLDRRAAARWLHRNGISSATILFWLAQADQFGTSSRVGLHGYHDPSPVWWAGNAPHGAGRALSADHAHIAVMDRSTLFHAAALTTTSTTSAAA